MKSWFKIPKERNAAVAAIVVVSGMLWYVLLAFTPLNRLVPSRLDAVSRVRYVDMAVRVDSISHALAVYQQYVSNIEALLGDSLPAVAADDTTATNLYDLPLDSLMGAGKAEERFVKQFEASERFNLSVLSPIAAEGMIFFPPVHASSLKANSSTGDMPALVISGERAQPVSAVYRGTVVDAYYATDKGVTVVIQHPNNFISQYSGLGDVFVSRGAKVNAGQRLGMSGGQRYPLTFMLWHDGSALDPGEYIEAPAVALPKGGGDAFIPSKKR